MTENTDFSQSEKQDHEYDTTFQTSLELPLAAQHALKEAEICHLVVKMESTGPTKIGGHYGKDPTRFSDWKVKGRAIDF